MIVLGLGAEGGHAKELLTFYNSEHLTYYSWIEKVTSKVPSNRLLLGNTLLGNPRRLGTPTTR
eukprot:1662165-Pyramimonas_sp.AAC.1